MTIKTKVVWASDQVSSLLHTKAIELVGSGVTDGTTELINGAVYRTWTTTEAAQEWVDFLNQQSPTPTEAVVVTE
jgi:hypothetical protein